MNPALLFALTAAFVGGALVALQAPTNAMLSRAVGSPVNAALVSFAIGTVALVTVALALGVRPAAGEVKVLPWYAWTGGLYGAVFVAVAAFAAPRMGVTYFASWPWPCSRTGSAPSASPASRSAPPGSQGFCWSLPGLGSCGGDRRPSAGWDPSG
jgi:hypothetical protein